MLDVAVAIAVLQVYLEDSSCASACCPRQAPTSGVVKYTYGRSSQPYSAHQRYCQLPVSGRKMRRFSQFSLGYHKLPIATGRCAGIVRASRQCRFAVLGPWVMRGIWFLIVHLWLRCGLTMIICSLPLPLPCAPFLRRARSPECFSLCHGLLQYDERIAIATRWHMRSDLLAGESM